MKTSMWKVTAQQVIDGNPIGIRMTIATFYCLSYAERFADQIRNENKTWIVRIIHPN